MKQKPSVTLPELVKKLTAPVITTAVGCDRSLPGKWERGQRPGWRYLEALSSLANDNGLSLSLNFLNGAK